MCIVWLISLQVRVGGHEQSHTQPAILVARFVVITLLTTANWSADWSSWPACGGSLPGARCCQLVRRAAAEGGGRSCNKGGSGRGQVILLRSSLFRHDIQLKPYPFSDIMWVLSFYADWLSDINDVRTYLITKRVILSYFAQYYNGFIKILQLRKYRPNDHNFRCMRRIFENQSFLWKHVFFY